MTNKVWITDTNATDDGVALTDPLDIVSSTVGDKIICTGWWKAGVASDAMEVAEWEINKGVGDELWYVTKWNDDSGLGNHLVDTSVGSAGQGPQIYGSHGDYLGDINDEVGDGTTSYPVAHFANITTGEAQGQLYLKCNTASTADDFRVSDGTEPLLTFIAVCRHHYDSTALSQTSTFNQIGDMGVVISSISPFNTLGTNQWWGIGFGEGHVGLNVALQPCFNNSPVDDVLGGDPLAYTNVYEEIGATPVTHDRVKNVYGTIGFWQQSVGTEDGGYDQQNALMTPFINAEYVTKSTQETWSGAGDHGIQPSGEASSDIRIGTSARDMGGSGIGGGFEGRIVEMVCYKSDNPITPYNRMRLLKYFNNKFSNNI